MAGAPRPFVGHQACLAIGCDVEVPAHMPMCSRHWALVPRRVQLRLWEESRKRTSPRFAAVAHTAIAIVASREQRHGEAHQARFSASLAAYQSALRGQGDPLIGLDLPEPLPPPSEAG